MTTGETEVNELEYLKKKKAELKEQQDEIDRQIEVVKAQKERRVSIVGLYNRMDSLIKTSSSSFSDVSIGEVIEYAGDLSLAEEYSRTIDVEISARRRETDFDDDPVYSFGVSALGKRYADDPTVVVSYLIPYDLVKDDPFFRSA